MTDQNAAADARAAMEQAGMVSTPEAEPMLRWFAYDHLKGDMRTVSLNFSNLAHTIVLTIPRSAERTVALRKLLESKDAAVRAVLPA